MIVSRIPVIFDLSAHMSNEGFEFPKIILLDKKTSFLSNCKKTSFLSNCTITMIVITKTPPFEKQEKPH